MKTEKEMDELNKGIQINMNTILVVIILLGLIAMYFVIRSWFS